MIGRIIRQEREARKLTRRTVAKETEISRHVLRNYERGRQKVCRVWLSRFVKIYNIENLHISEYLRQRDIRTATRDELEFLYEGLTVNKIAELYSVSWKTARKQMDAVGIRKQPTPHDYYQKSWVIEEDGETHTFKNLKAFCEIKSLNYWRVRFEIDYYGRHENEHFTITRPTPSPPSGQPDDAARADEDWEHVG